MFRTVTVIAAAAVLSAGVLALPASASPAPAPPYRLATVITGPGVPPPDPANGQWCYDLVSVDTATHRAYISDATSKQIDVINTRTDKLLAPIGHGDFTGPGGCTSFNFSQEGPQGNVVAGDRIWAGNGNSHVLVYSTATGKQVADINTGGDRRADELAYDPAAGTILVTNPDETDGHPFATLINTTTYRVISRITIPGAVTLEQPAWNPADGNFYMSVPQTSSLSGGEIAVLSPAGNLLRAYPAANCQPGGLAIAAYAQKMMIGCNTTAALEMSTAGAILGRFPAASGVDEVWYNGGTRFFLGDYISPGLAVITVSGRYLGSMPAVAGAGFHSGAAGNNQAFLPGGNGISVWKRTG